VVLYGVDGCRAGWIAAISAGAGLEFDVFPTFADVLAHANDETSLVVVDVPIGLPHDGPRECDLVARRLLGLRRSSVFPAPCRPTLGATSFADACARNRRASRKGVTKQLYGILAKIREVDDAMTPALQVRVREAHPELTFAFLSGRRTGLAHAKKTTAGASERLGLLQAMFPRGIDIAAIRARLGRSRVLPDDLVDAVACLATARRILDERALVLPEGPGERDARGLRMEIVA
jgi:predicted RNase H-like nuclease